MASLAPGILLKLMNAMNTGTKPTGEHRNALLQVTDIVPIDLDANDLLPKHGFYIKVSDSSHSVYVSLPFEQEDLVLSNKMQLGQFIYVERFEPGSPVPVIKGTKPLPGRRPLVGMPEPIMALREKGEKTEPRSNDYKCSIQKRASWGEEQNAVDVISSPFAKPVTLVFDHSTPLRRSSPMRIEAFPTCPVTRRRIGDAENTEVCRRSSVGGFSFTKVDGSKEEILNSVRKSCNISSVPKFSRGMSAFKAGQKITKGNSNFNSTENLGFTTLPNVSRDVHNPSNSGWVPQSLPSLLVHFTSKNSGDRKYISLPGKLSIIGKEVMQQREVTEKLALQALRIASAVENLVQILKSFSQLSSSASVDTPTSCFDQFLSFHQQIVQAITDMESIHAATETAQSAAVRPEEPTPELTGDYSILHEIQRNCIEQKLISNLSSSKRISALRKSISFRCERSKFKTPIARNLTQLLDREDLESASETDVINNNLCSTSLLYAIEWGKQIETEAGNWFMEFLEAALENGLKKQKGSKANDTELEEVSCCPQSQMLKVINWVEIEQCYSNKRPAHPRAVQIARKLRIKVRTLE